MEKKLLNRFIQKIILFAIIVAGVSIKGYAQTTLSPGDITVVSVNADDNKSFDVVPLVDLQQGTIIYFTDNAYVDADGTLKDNEGTLKYTASLAVSAGSINHYDGSDGNGFVETSGDYNVSAGGDNLIVYQNNSGITYLYGVGWAKGSSAWNYSSSTSSNKSDIPPGLSE